MNTKYLNRNLAKSNRKKLKGGEKQQQKGKTEKDRKKVI